MNVCNYCGSKFVSNDIKVTEMVDGIAYSLAMCNQCAADLVYSNKKLSPQLSTKIKVEVEVEKGSSLKIRVDQEKPDLKGPCPNCGLDVKTLIKTGRFGCSICYEHYFDEFSIIAAIHQEGAIEHVGKRPKIPISQDPIEQIKLLKLLKAKAVELENYEEAARLAEELRKLST